MLREIRKNPQTQREEQKTLALRNKNCCTRGNVQCLTDNTPCSETVSSDSKEIRAGILLGIDNYFAYAPLRTADFSAQVNKQHYCPIAADVVLSLPDASHQKTWKCSTKQDLRSSTLGEHAA